MKIIAVNISKTINDIGSQKATERAWKLNKERADKYRFVMGVNKGKIYPFELLKVCIDEVHENRIAFVLKECSNEVRINVEKYVEGINLKYITTKYIK